MTIDTETLLYGMVDEQEPEDDTQRQQAANAYTKLRGKGFVFTEEVVQHMPITLSPGQKLQLFTPWGGLSMPLVSVEIGPGRFAEVTPLKRGSCRVQTCNGHSIPLASATVLNPLSEYEDTADLRDGQVSIIAKLNCDWDAVAAVPRLTICVWEGAVVRVHHGGVG